MYVSYFINIPINTIYILHLTRFVIDKRNMKCFARRNECRSAVYRSYFFVRAHVNPTHTMFFTCKHLRKLYRTTFLLNAIVISLIFLIDFCLHFFYVSTSVSNLTCNTIFLDSIFHLISTLFNKFIDFLKRKNYPH